jgi:UDP-N-acetyl-D-mannosaminuronic acid dehydrogenase
MFAAILQESGLDPWQDLKVVHSPERVLPGHILQELVSNDRVIGGLTPEAGEQARALYASFVQGEICLSDAQTAEMVKLMENTYRDVNIALANEFALVAEAIGTNVWQAIEIANRHPRVNILRPGPGVGGHCIAIDPWFLVQAAPGPSQLIASARRLNDRMPEHVVELLGGLTAGIKNPRVAALGIAYKANVDDIRESPALTVIRWLQATGCEVRAFDPHIKNSEMNRQLRMPIVFCCLRITAILKSLIRIIWVRECVITCCWIPATDCLIKNGRRPVLRSTYWAMGRAWK